MVKPKEPKVTKKTDKQSVTEFKASVVKGSHLTVITDEMGKTTLIWDDEALCRDVRNAILKAESTIPVTTEPQPKVKTVRGRKSKV